MNLRQCAGAACLLAASTACKAVEPLDTFSVRVGGYVTEFDTQVRADGRNATGTRIDLKRDLGLDKSDAIGFAGLSWRPFTRHEVGASYYQDSAEAEQRTRRSFEFNGTHYEADARLKARFDLDAYEAWYVYWAWNRPTWALGPRLGLLWYKLELGLMLRVQADAGNAGGDAENEIEGDLPAPTIGGSWRWTPGAHWRVGVELGYFTATVDDIDAEVTFGRAGVEWFPWERWGISLDYTLRQIDAEVEKSSFDGDLRFVDSGLRLGLTYRF